MGSESRGFGLSGWKLEEQGTPSAPEPLEGAQRPGF